MLAGHRVQVGHGYATALPSFDVETYSEAGWIWTPESGRYGQWLKPEPLQGSQKKGLGICGVRNYFEHPSARTLSLVYDLRDGSGEQLWLPHDPYPSPLIEHVMNGGLIGAWNAGFEWHWWNILMHRRHGWPVLPIRQMRCSMAKGRAYTYPAKLVNAGPAARVPVLKDKDGTRLLNKFSEPRDPTAQDARRYLDPAQDPVDGPKLYNYNAQDIRSEFAVSMTAPDLSPDEQEIWFTDQGINQRGCQVDVDGIDNCIAIVEQAFDKYNARLRYITGDAVESATKLPSLKKWLRETCGIHVDSLAEDQIDEVLKWPSVQQHALAKEALEIRQKIGSASIKKLYALKYAHHNGRMYDMYSYWGADPGRWSGRGPQPQNLPRPAKKFENIKAIEEALGIIASRSLDLVEAVYGDAIDTVISCLRSMFIAAPDHDLVSSDFSAIEGVVLACLAGEEWRIEVFQTHGMIYEASAAKMTGLTLQDFIDYKAKNKAHHPYRQNYGKLGELSGQYGSWIGGWKSFGAEEFLGSDDNIKKAILDWRAASPSFVEYWGGQTRGRFQSARPELFGLEGAAINAIKNPGVAFTVRGQVAFEARGGNLYLRLPSGRIIAYHDVQLHKSTRPWAHEWEVEITYSCEDRQTGQWVREKLYGGIFCNNVVQGTARDLQANAIVRVERAGYPVVMHTHDEVTSEVRRGFGSVEEFEREANTLPEWARMPDGRWWPVRMKGGFRQPRYGKFED